MLEHLHIKRRQCPDRVPAVKRGLGAIHAFRSFGLVGAKEAIPKNEYRTEIFVDVLVVDRVVHPVVGRGREDFVKPAQAADVFGVDPKLVHEDKHADDGKFQWGDAQHRHGKEKEATDHRVQALLAQGGREVEQLALVVDHVRAPEKSAMVAKAVQPVIDEIVEQESGDPTLPMPPKMNVHQIAKPAIDELVGANLKEGRANGHGLADDALA